MSDFKCRRIKVPINKISNIIIYFSRGLSVCATLEMYINICLLLREISNSVTIPSFCRLELLAVCNLILQSPIIILFLAIANKQNLFT